MNVVISRPLLTQLIGKIQSIVPSKPALPILCNMLIEAIDDQLIVTATDLTVSMRLFAEAKVVEEGAIALPARRFFQLVRELNTPQIKITTQGTESAEITAGSSFFKINGMHKAEFPMLADLSNTPHFSLPSNKLKELFLKTSFSAAREDTRYVLNGVLLQIAGKKSTFVATDGKRLAKSYSEIEIDPSFQGSYVFPLKAVDEMTKLLEDNGEEAFISLLPDKASLEVGNVTLITKLLAGQYPDIEKVIPQKPALTLTLHREELILLLRQVALFTSETSGSVRFSFSSGELRLLAASPDLGEGVVGMPVQYENQPMEIAFNPFFFLDILRHSKEETVQFGMTDSYNPGLITDDSGSLFVIMPMRINETSIPIMSQKSEF